MSVTTLKRQCPACGTLTAAASCCGVPMRRRFVMDTARVRSLRAHVHGRKGLDDATYRLHLQAVGATSTLTLTEAQYHALLKRLNALPDRQRPQGQGRAAR